MTSLSHCIELAVKAGYETPENSKRGGCFHILLDPLFWQALGKELGWSQSHKHYEKNERKSGSRHVYEWHRLLDHLASGKDADSFFEVLLEARK